MQPKWYWTITLALLLFWLASTFLILSASGFGTVGLFTTEEAYARFQFAVLLNFVTLLILIPSAFLFWLKNKIGFYLGMFCPAIYTALSVNGILVCLQSTDYFSLGLNAVLMFFGIANLFVVLKSKPIFFVEKKK